MFLYHKKILITKFETNMSNLSHAKEILLYMNGNPNNIIFYGIINVTIANFVN